MSIPHTKAGETRAWPRALVVFLKEVRDHLRDRRSLVLALVYPLSGPVLLGILISMSGGVGGGASGAQAPSPPRVIGVMQAENAPALIGWLGEQGVTTVPIRSDPASVVTRGHIPVVLDIGQPPPGGKGRLMVRVMADQSRMAGLTATATISQLLSDYGRLLARSHLLEAGLDPLLVDPISVQQVSVGRPPDIARFVYNLIPALTIFIIFLGAVYISVDSTVGERERGSWEPLLTAPVHRRELLIGKAGAALVFTAAAVAFNLLSFKLVLETVVGSAPGLTPPPSVATLLMIFLIGAPIMALAVVLQMSVGAVARSLKEAQIYLGLLPLLPAFAGMMFAFAPVAPSAGLLAIPVVGQMVLFGQLVGDGVVLWWQAGLSALTTLALVGLLSLLAARLFEREALSANG